MIEIARVHDRAGLSLWVELTERVTGIHVAVELLEHEARTQPDCLHLVATLDGEPAGTGIGKRSSVPDCLYAMARVVPERRRRGVGLALVTALSEHARRIGLGLLIGSVEEADEQSFAFLRRHGFDEVGRERAVALELGGVEAPAPVGVEIASLDDRPELAEAAWRVESEAVADVPAPEPLTAQSYERWRADNLDGPTALPDACVVALEAGRVVGYAGLVRLDDTTAEHLLTAVLRPWRGRGIATALKQAQIARAKEAGLTRLLTTNDETNLPMRRINERLGYKPLPGEIVVRGPTFPPA